MHFCSAVFERVNRPIGPITCFAVFLLLSLLLFVGTLGLSLSSILFAGFLALTGPWAWLLLTPPAAVPQTKSFKDFTRAQRWQFVLMCIATTGTALGGLLAGIWFAFGYPLLFFIAFAAFTVGIPTGAVAAIISWMDRRKSLS